MRNITRILTSTLLSAALFAVADAFAQTSERPNVSVPPGGTANLRRYPQGVSDGARNPEARGGRGATDGDPERPAPPKKREKLAPETNYEALRREMIADGIAYLSKAQLESGSFSASPRVGIGPTIVDTIGLLRAGVPTTNPTVAKALAYLGASIQDDGGIYSQGGRLSSYESCLGLVCFSLANKSAGDGRYDKILADAERFVRSTQYNASSGVSQEDERFGGVGYGAGRDTRPDLSNTQFFMEALREIGAGEDDQAIQDALVFVSRCQNLETEYNAGVGGAKSSDGGFIYTFIAPDENPAGQEANGGLRSYGSMTYAGLKSLIYAGLTADDPRVTAATDWIKNNYSLTQNPGLGKKGLYYYYHTLSKCFMTLGAPTFTDKDGVAHDWRRELIETLALAENADGSWVNDDRMWFETDANLVTGYVLTVLSYCAEGTNE